MHVRRTARDRYFPSRADDAFFAARGDVVFLPAPGSSAARAFAQRVNAMDARVASDAIRPAELAAMALVHEIFHAVIGIFRKRHPTSFDRLLSELGEKLGERKHETLRAFIGTFPPPAVYRGDDTPEKLLARAGKDAEDVFTEETLLLWLVNQNPAYEPVRAIVTDAELPPSYRVFVAEAKRFFDHEPAFGPRGQTLVELLLEPSRRSPNDIFGQLEIIQDEWGHALGLDELGIWRKIAWAKDFLFEEGKWFMRAGPGPGEPLLDAMRFGRAEDEPMRFSEDKGWMPRVVLIAKSAYVWLDQLSRKYSRAIERLDQVPDEELDLLARRGFTGLWLIGLFERSRASQRIKQTRGDGDALASAYSLKRYDIADVLGGGGAYANLRDRAWARGIRLAADMVPNHVGIDGDWVLNHPDWFLRAPHPPYPSYRFGGPDLSDDPRVGVFIDEGYWNNTDAAVVFRRHDRWTGSDTFIYHGNDGTSMPWNDTAQLDYTRAEVRHAVIETILHVARMFPIIRFDAAMTLAKRHYRRLWFPPPGQGGAIPSRSDYAMTDDEFERVFPVEFWREVVDTVAERAPETLLLAEAFWMMEGYFVRSLGMHRVYNSAFMNMLKREENSKYRQTIKNVLEFDPRILERFVNFMNNPDEETAIAQFGSDDKYFGVCMLMCTMPGLPMFGHGQIEGFHEKYGMEYRRPKWSESPNEGLVARHEREIFPLLKRRWLFSGVSQFALYDFVTEDGHVNEDVYAYSNRVGGETALVLYNNKFSHVRGRLHGSVASKREDGSMQSTSIEDALGLTGQGGYTVFRDLTGSALEYIRPTAELSGEGFFWELHAFKYHVFTGFGVVHACAERPYDQLCADLAGRGVPSIERALLAVKFRPIHAPLREALGEGHIAWLAQAWDEKRSTPTKDGEDALEERLGFVADGLAYMRARTIERTRAVDAALARYRSTLALAQGVFERPGAARARAAMTEPPRSADVERFDIDRVLAWLHVEAVMDLLATVETDAARADLVTRWELALPLVDAETARGRDENQAKRRAAVVLLLATLPRGPLRETMHAALGDARARAFLGVHDAGGTTWVVKEPYVELAEALAERQAVEGRASMAMARREAEDLVRLADTAGWRADEIVRALAPKTRAPLPPRGGGSGGGTRPREERAPTRHMADSDGLVTIAAPPQDILATRITRLPPKRRTSKPPALVENEKEEAPARAKTRTSKPPAPKTRTSKPPAAKPAKKNAKTNGSKARSRKS
jgi:glycosidase